MIIANTETFSRYKKIIPQVEIIMDFIKVNNADIKTGRYELTEGCYVNVVEGNTQPIEDGIYEAHQRFLDIHYVCEGQEWVKYNDTSKLEIRQVYDESTDAGFYSGEGAVINIKEEWLYVVFPEEAHMPCVHLKDQCSYKKFIFKIPV